MTLVDRFRDLAAREPGARSHAFLAQDPREPPTWLTRGELERRAASVAAALQDAGAEGERVLVLLPPGLDFVVAFLGCLLAGAAAVPAHAALGRRRPWLEVIAADSRARFALLDPPTRRRWEDAAARPEGLSAVRTLPFEACAAHDPLAWRPPALAGDRLAFVQYTSGSTAAPRGVMVSHENLRFDEEEIQHAMGHGPGTCVVTWLPPYHDMGLIGGLLQPLYAGGSCVLMSPATFLRRPSRWLEAITAFRAHTSGAPDFAYRLCVERTTPEERARLDLGSWKVAFTGAEPVRADTLEAFTRAFEPHGFRREAFFPCYGLAEGTLMVSAGRAGAGPVTWRVDAATLGAGRAVGVAERAREAGATLVGCGRTLRGQELVVVDPATGTLRDDGVVGEIWVRGPGVALGYWDRPEETRRTFGAELAGSGKAPFLRTGDLGVLKDGELFVTGRLKDLMILRGRNHYPHDIERTVEGSHPAIRSGGSVAFSVERDGAERLVVLAEIEETQPDTEPERIVAAIRGAVTAEHEVQVHAVLLVAGGSIPKTSSGKLRRGASRAAFLERSVEVLAESVLECAPVLDASSGRLDARSLRDARPEDRQKLVERRLVELIAAAVGVPATDLQPSMTTGAAGADSLAAVRVAHALEEEIGVRLSMARLLEAPSIAACARDVLDALESDAPPSRAVAPREREPGGLCHPLSFGQEALWFLHRLAPADGAAYNMAQSIEIAGPVDVRALRLALAAVVARHDALRTTFAEVAGTPVQRVHDRVDVPLEAEDAHDAAEGELELRLEAAARRAFDLERGPLLRATLFSLAQERHVLLLVLHHIVADGWSLRVVVGDLARLHESIRAGGPPDLAPVAGSYVEFVRAQRELVGGEFVRAQIARWCARLRGSSALGWPPGASGPRAAARRCGRRSFGIAPATVRALADTARRENATLFMALLAGFKALLHERSGRDDLAVGTDHLNRSGPGARDLVGHCVNQLVLRTDLSGAPTFRDLLRRVRAVALDAYADHDAPFPCVVRALGPERSPGRNPLFQIMFTFRSASAAPSSGAGSSWRPREVGAVDGSFDLTLALESGPEGIAGVLVYDAGLVEADAAEALVRDYGELLATVAVAPDRRLPATAAEGTKAVARPRSLASRRPRVVEVSPASLVRREDLPPGGPFLSIAPAHPGVDLHDWARANLPSLEADLAARGAVLFRGFGVETVAAFDTFLRAVCTDLFSQNGEHPRDAVSGHIHTPVHYASDRKLLWHNENTFNRRWPAKLWFCCVRPAREGGETPLVDSRAVYRALDPALRQRFVERQVMYVRTYGAEVGLDWRDVFRTSNRAEVEELCRRDGIAWDWTHDGRLKTRCVRPAAARHPRTGEMSWCNQAQHWHVACLDPDVRGSLQGLYAEDDLPRNCRYGDGSPIEDSVMREILDVYRSLEVVYPWRQGDVLMLDNLLVAHGRNPFVGERSLLVAMGEMLSYDELGASASPACAGSPSNVAEPLPAPSP